MSEKKKGKPGRPRTQDRVRKGHRGIINEPDKEFNIMEMSYDNPAIFSTIFASEQRVVESDIILAFEPTKATIIGKADGAIMVVDFNCANLISYYCAGEYYYEGKCSSILNVITTKKKGDNRITFSISSNELTKLNLTISKSSETLKKNWSVTLTKIAKPNFEEIEIKYAEKKNYPLSFRVNWSQFKGLISSWKKFKPEFAFIEKDIDDSPLRFIPEISDKDVKNSSDYESDIDIQLKYTGEEIFSTKFSIKKLNPITSSDALSDLLYLFVDDEQDLICEAFLDEEFDDEKEAKPGTELAKVRFFTRMI